MKNNLDKVKLEVFLFELYREICNFGWLNLYYFPLQAFGRGKSYDSS